MTNPLFESLDDHIRGEHVRVVGNDGTTYEGWCERIHHHDRHILLRDAVNVDRGDDVGTAYVAHCDSIEVLETDSRIERVTIDDVEPTAYAAREFDREGNCQYIARVRDNGWVGSFPVVRETADGYEVVEGHKRLWVAEQAGLTTHPVEVVDADDWELARRFVVDHLPDEEQVNEDGTARGCYDGEQIETAIARLIDRWDERAFDLPRVEFNANRVDAGVGDDSDPTGTERRPTDMDPEPEGEATDEDVEAAVDDHDELPEFDELLDKGEDTDVQEDSDTTDFQTEAEAEFRDRVSEATDDGESLGTYDVKEYASVQLPFSGGVYNHFRDAGVDRVHVRESDGRYELSPGGSDQWPDYAVSRNSLMIGAPGVRVMGLEGGDEVEAHADGRVVVLTPVDGAGQPAEPDEDGIDESPDGDDTGKVADDTPATEADDDDVGQSAGGPATIDRDDEDVYWWCGYCGEGKWVRKSGVDDHHDREDHPGEPVPRTVEPTTNELVATEGDVGNFATDDTDNRVAEWVTGGIPDRSAFTTEDVAVECDITGNEARAALETLDLDDYLVERDGVVWRVRVAARVGGDA